MTRGKFVDLTGQKFGKLTVLKRDVEKKKVYYICKCECGNIKSIRADALRDGISKSCGCMISVVASKFHKKYNKYDLTGEYGIGYTLKSKQPFLFDLEDYDKIKNYCWYMTAEGYVHNKNSNGYISMHRLVMGEIENKYVIDHINRKRNDNRKLNLRITTQQKNTENRTKPCNNTSSVMGVIYRKDRHSWIAMLKNKRLGSSQNKEEAIRIRLLGELEYYGVEFAPQKHLFKKYNIK